ncbi:MAG: alpha/beta hydrolase [Acidobacteriota bacterium]
MSKRTRRILIASFRGVAFHLAFATVIAAQVIDHPSSAGDPENQFIEVNHVRLHYLDWGGTGESILFLTSLGGQAGDFQPIAAQLLDRYHVLGLTRRGQGRSGKPIAGYDTLTLTEDILAFLDAKSINRVTLIGYSLAGNEMTEFAGRYPQRVARLVYLDAAYDLAENAATGRKAKLNLPTLPGADHATLELIARSNEYRPDYSRIKAPALGFFVTYDEPPKSSMWDEATKVKLLAWWHEYGKAYRRSQIERFQAGVARTRTVELHGTTHGGFVFEAKQQAILIRETRKFLNEFGGE